MTSHKKCLIPILNVFSLSKFLLFHHAFLKGVHEAERITYIWLRQKDFREHPLMLIRLVDALLQR